MFGYKQRGKTAELSNNLFYHLCYEGAVDMEKIHDLEERYALEVQIGEFGQVPKQLFASPHPARIIFEGKPWTSLYMDGTAVKNFLVICPHEAGTWDPIYSPGVDFWDHDFLLS